MWAGRTVQIISSSGEKKTMEVHEEMDPPWILETRAGNVFIFCRGIAALTLGGYNLLQMYNIIMFQRFQNFHLANGRDRKSIFLRFRIDSLEGYNFSCYLIGAHKHASIYHGACVKIVA